MPRPSPCRKASSEQGLSAAQPGDCPSCLSLLHGTDGDGEETARQLGCLPEAEPPTAQQKPFFKHNHSEFYINGNFQLSHSSVSMRGLGTGGISQRRTQQCCGRTSPPAMTPTTTQRGCMGSLHAKTSSQQRACLPAATQDMLS